MSYPLHSMIERGMEFISGLPTWIILVVVISIVMKLFGSTIKTMVRVVLFLFILSLIFSLLGLSLPSPSTVIEWFNGLLSNFNA